MQPFAGSTSLINMKLMAGYFSRLEDRRLVGAFLARRDERAFRALYHRHSPRLYQLALRWLRWHKHDAEEVLQETWLRAVQNMPAFRWESSFPTWLTAIAVNCCRERFRSRNRRENEFTPEEPMTASFDNDAMRIDLENAIAALPEGYRAVLLLHDLEGYTHEEIGCLLGIEAGTSKSQLFHARRAVRGALQKYRHHAQIGERKNET